MKRILYILALISLGSHAQYVQLGNKLVGTGSVGASQFGLCVGISADGQTAIAGAPEDNLSTGAAWIYTFNGSSFIQVGNKLVGTGNIGNANQGYGVSLSGDGKIAVVGGLHDNGYGAAWIYTFNGTNFVQAGNKLVGTGVTSSGGMGTSVAISADGSTIVIGAPYNDSSVGTVWVYTFNGTNFIQLGNKLTGTGYVGGSNQGFSVNISDNGKTLIVGGSSDNSNVGAAWIYTFNGTNFVQVGNKLVGSGGVGQSRQARIVSLSSDGKIATIGSQNDDSNTGATWVFSFNGINFVQLGNKLVATDNVGAASQAAATISSDAKTIVVGGPFDNSTLGATWFYTFNGSNFVQAGSKVVGTGSIGQSAQGNWTGLSANGSIVIAGGPLDNGSTGAAWVFVRTTTACSLPVIVGITSPASNCINSTQLLSVTASGIALTYQWYHNGSILPGATLSGLNITIFSISGDNYTCNVINTCGVISSSFNLPNIIPLIGYRNDNLIVLNTSPGAAYQWMKNGSDEPSQTDPTHTNQLFNTEYQVRATITGCPPITSGPMSIFKSMQTTTVTVIQVVTATSCNTSNDNLRLESSPDISIDMDVKTGRLNVIAPPKSIGRMEITDAKGLIIESLPQVAFVDFTDKTPGIYTIKALNKKGSILKMFRVHLE